MKKIFLLTLTSIIASHSSHAFLAVSQVSAMSLPVYGLYMTADPTCTTGLIATIPLTKTPQTINFASANTAIGAGAVPATVGCVVAVVGNSLTTSWPAGTYTTSSNSSADSVCNAGGSFTGQRICNGSSTTPTWPAQIITDAAAAGLTLKTTSCSTGTSADIIPLVLSTNSACTGNSVSDASVAACSGGNVNNFAMPTKSADPSNGTKLTASSTAGNLKFVVNPANTLGSNGSSCGNLAAPLFSFSAQ